MGKVEASVKLLKEEIDQLEKESRCLTERRKQVRRQWVVAQRLIKILLHPTPEEQQGPSSRAAGVREAWTAWMVEHDSRLKELLQKPGAKSRWRQLLVHEPPLAYGKVIDELQRL